MLDRLVGRASPIDLAHKAEAVSLVLWDPDTGAINADWPETGSRLRIERFSEQVQSQYDERYNGMNGMPPHDKPSQAQKRALEAAGEEVPESEGTEDDSEVVED